MNFVRDALTNAFTLGAELGPEKAGRLLAGISADVAGNQIEVEVSSLNNGYSFQFLQAILQYVII
jgi:hypothetical protein